VTHSVAKVKLLIRDVIDGRNYVSDDASKDVEDEAKDNDGHRENLIKKTVLRRQSSKKLSHFTNTNLISSIAK